MKQNPHCDFNYIVVFSVSVGIIIATYINYTVIFEVQSGRTCDQLIVLFEDCDMHIKKLISCGFPDQNCNGGIFRCKKI